MKPFSVTLSLTFSFLALTGAGALAAKKSKGETKVVYEKHTKYDFNGKDVDGDFLKPDGSAIRGDQNLTYDSLLKPRKNFSKELNRSSGALR